MTTTTATETPRIWNLNHRDATTGKVTLLGIAQIAAFIGDHTEIAFFEADGNPAAGTVQTFTVEGAAAYLERNGYRPA